MARCRRFSWVGKTSGVAGAAQQDQLGGEGADAGQCLQVCQCFVAWPGAECGGVELALAGGPAEGLKLLDLASGHDVGEQVRPVRGDAYPDGRPVVLGGEREVEPRVVAAALAGREAFREAGGGGE